MNYKFSGVSGYPTGNGNIRDGGYGVDICIYY